MLGKFDRSQKFERSKNSALLTVEVCLENRHREKLFLFFYHHKMSHDEEVTLDNKASHLDWLNPQSTNATFGKPFDLAEGLAFIFVKINDNENVNFIIKSSATMFLKNKFKPGPISDDKLAINFRFSEKDRLVGDLINFLLQKVHEFAMSQEEQSTARQLAEGIELATWPANERLNAKFKSNGEHNVLTEFIEAKNGATFTQSSLSAFKEFMMEDMKQSRKTEIDSIVHLTGFLISESGIFPCFKLWRVEFPLIKTAAKISLKRKK